MTTVLFVHGTGVRNPGYEDTFKLIEQKLHAERPDLKVERCLWGDSLGIKAKEGFYQGLAMAKPIILEPIMLVEVETPNDFVGRIQGDLLSRRGVVLGSHTMEGYPVIRAEVPLKTMFGYSTDLRSLTSGQASFSMEFATYHPVPASQQTQLIEKAAR